MEVPTSGKRNLSQISSSSSTSEDLDLNPSQFDQLIGSIQSVKSELLSRQDSFDDKLTAIEGKLSKLDHIEHSIDELKQKQVEQTSFSESLQFQVAALKDENAALTSKVEGFESAMKAEAQSRNDLERQQRRYNLEISGIAQANDKENTFDLVADFFKKLDAHFNPDCLDVAHRKKNGSIIVRFMSRKARDTIYGMRRQVRNKSAGDYGYKPSSPSAKLYINESLTFQDSRVARDARAACRAFNNIYAQGDSNKHMLNKVVTGAGIVYHIDQGGNFHMIKEINDLKLKADLSSEVIFKY